MISRDTQRIALVIAYHTGAPKGEIRKIRLDKIDFKAKRIDLLGSTTKNKKPRYLPIHGDMQAELSMSISRADLNCPFLVQDRLPRLGRLGEILENSLRARWY